MGPRVAVLRATTFLALTLVAPPVDATEYHERPPAFVAVDTSRLMGSPDPLPLMEFEQAFPHLKIVLPVQPAHAGDGTNRIFVVTQDGRIVVFPNRLDAKRATTFLDIRERVSRPGGDNGMFAVAFHPQFRNNGLFFVVYTTRAAPKSTVVSRFRVSETNPDQADPASEVEFLRVKQPFADHNAACLAFGPDGMLYIALGDGGYSTSNENAQDLSTLLGCMLRIDVDRRDGDLPYAVPKDNPFVSSDDARREIWCYGLRAPWRFSFDRLTGDCWLGDNGQLEFEEVNLVRPGMNYGWMPREGFHAFDPSGVDPRGRPIPGDIALRFPDINRNDGFEDPVIEYDHTQGKSVVGGFVYRGRRLPELVGAYLYGDFVNGNIWALRRTGQDTTENRLIARTRLQITSFGEDEAGELYFTGFDGFVYQLRPATQTTESERFPARLSETGLFASVPDLVPIAGLIPYTVNVPLWSDYAAKERYLAMPHAASVEYSDNGPWRFPVGTVFVKTFSLHTNRTSPSTRRRLETRLLVHNPRGWIGYTYRWNEEQTDALLLGGAASSTISGAANQDTNTRSWYFPSRSDCMVCHTRASEFVLGMNTRQINRPHEYGNTTMNQLTMLSRLGIFRKPFGKPPEQLPAWNDWKSQAGSVNERARAYLDVNCAMCHTPPGFTRIDLRCQTPLEDMSLLGMDPEKPRVGPDDSKLIQPGRPERSELLLRMMQSGPGRMPNLASSQIDEQACDVIRKWIRLMPP